jgi:hypothetical protein
MCNKSNSKFIIISKTFKFVWENHFLFHRPLWQKKVESGGKSTQILEATKLSCADYNQCGHALSKYLSSYVYASSDHFWGFVVTKGTEIGLNVVGKGARVNQHPPMRQLAILSMGWAAFFHPASISQLFFGFWPMSFFLGLFFSQPWPSYYCSKSFISILAKLPPLDKAPLFIG